MSLEKRAEELHRSSIVIDGCSFFSRGWHERLEKAGVTALQMTAPWPNDDLGQALRRCEEYYRMTEADPRLVIIKTTEDIKKCKAEGKVGFILGSQSAQILGNDIRLVRLYHRFGVRVIQLTYNERNFLGDGCLEPGNAGLSKFGKAVVREMNDAGILVDLSHVGERTSLDAIEVSTRPCVFSHANSRALVNMPRNITDEQIKLCAQAGGVIGVSSFPPTLWTGGPEPPSVEVMIANIERTVDIAGVDHIAIGTDSECYPGSYPPELSRSLAAESPEVYGPFRKAFPKGSRTQGFENMESLPHLTHLLLERGWKECDIKKLLGENFMRVYKVAWGA